MSDATRVDPSPRVKACTAIIAKLFHKLDSESEAEIRQLKRRIKDLEEALEVHKKNERSLQKIIDSGKERTSLLSRRKSIAIPQQMVTQVHEANLTRRHSLRKSFADEGILKAFRSLPDLDTDSPTLRRISDNVMKLHFENPLMGVSLVTKSESPELVVEYKDPKEEIKFRKYSLVRTSVLEHVAFWCDIHKFPTDVTKAK
jgi:hypothetical protein